MSDAPYDPSRVRIYPGVRLGRDVVVHDFCVIGIPRRGARPGEAETVIGDGAVIRPFTTIYAGVTIGSGFSCGQGVTIREDNVLGESCSVGTMTDLEIGNRIGDRVRIHSGCGLGHAVLDDDVLVGPWVLLLDDPHPPCPRYEECVGGPKVRHHARIGGCVVVNPGVTIGANSFVGSGTLVATDVPPSTVFWGHPGRPRGRVERVECFKGFYPRAFAWDPPELFDPSLLPPEGK